MRLVQRHAKALDPVRSGSNVASTDRRDDPIEDHAGEKLRRRIAAREVRVFVEVAIVQPAEHRAQRLGRPADVDDHAVRVEVGPATLEIDHVGGAVHALRRPERIAAEAVGNHEVVADRDGVHRVIG